MGIYVVRLRSDSGWISVGIWLDRGRILVESRPKFSPIVTVNDLDVEAEIGPNSHRDPAGNRPNCYSDMAVVGGYDCARFQLNRGRILADYRQYRAESLWRKSTVHFQLWCISLCRAHARTNLSCSITNSYIKFDMLRIARCAIRARLRKYIMNEKCTLSSSIGILRGITDEQPISDRESIWTQPWICRNPIVIRPKLNCDLIGTQPRSD